jgi:hypothetical protein
MSEILDASQLQEASVLRNPIRLRYLDVVIGSRSTSNPLSNVGVFGEGAAPFFLETTWATPAPNMSFRHSLMQKFRSFNNIFV